MQACAYHEEAVAVGTCPSCEQSLCAKCFEAGSQGLCGMCAEVSAAKAASPAASPLNKASNPRPEETPRSSPKSSTAPSNGAGSLGARKGTASLEGGRKAPPRAQATVGPGMCPEHPETRAVVACEHCKRRVCGECLNLYGLCRPCAALPTCARHESLVAEDRCQSCKTPYCKDCLAGTTTCPQCKEKKGGGSNAAKSSKSATGKLDPAAGKAQTEGKGSPGKAGAAGPKGTTNKGTGRMSGGKAAAALAPKPGPSPWMAGGILLLVVGLLGWFFMGSGRPRLSEAEASMALRDAMTKVQAAAMAYHQRNREYPNNSQAILSEMEAQGVKIKELPLPLKLVVNVPPTEAWSIGYSQTGMGFEVRGVDGLGRPFSVDGRDVILRPSLRANPGLPSALPLRPEAGSPGGASGGEGSGGN